VISFPNIKALNNTRSVLTTLYPLKRFNQNVATANY
jgi:hypothetical protein